MCEYVQPFGAANIHVGLKSDQSAWHIVLQLEHAISQGSVCRVVHPKDTYVVTDSIDDTVCNGDFFQAPRCREDQLTVVPVFLILSSPQCQPLATGDETIIGRGDCDGETGRKVKIHCSRYARGVGIYLIDIAIHICDHVDALAMYSRTRVLSPGAS